jgi:hypothetical protein
VMVALWMASREGLVWSSLVLRGCASGYWRLSTGVVRGGKWWCRWLGLAVCGREFLYIYIYIYMFLVVWSLSVSLVFTIEGLVRLKNIERLFYSLISS